MKSTQGLAPVTKGSRSLGCVYRGKRMDCKIVITGIMVGGGGDPHLKPWPPD